MKSRTKNTLLMLIATALAGCAGGSPDPHSSNIWDYNPDAYEQRAQERRDRLAAIEQGNQALRSESSRLETDKTVHLKEREVVEKELKAIAASVSSLEKSVKSQKAKTAVQKKEQQRILAELTSIRSSAKVSDNIANPEEKKLELERLKKRRDQLEKEAANLTKL